jgi:hypothetical protein
MLADGYEKKGFARQLVCKILILRGLLGRRVSERRYLGGCRIWFRVEAGCHPVRQHSLLCYVNTYLMSIAR